MHAPARTVLAIACCACAQQAAAAIVSGSFSGIAQDALLFGAGPAAPAFAGAPVQGRFRVDTALLGPQTLEDPDYASYRLTGDALLLEFTLLGTTYRFGDQGLASAATVYTGQGGQAVLFGANFLDTSYPTALLWMGGAVPAGAAGLYVDGLDLATLHAAPQPADELLVIGFQLGADTGATLAQATLRFDAPPAEVPEPAGWALLATGWALAAWRRARPVRGAR
ncbi:hypothetical protein [Pseudorhodoferax sp.]|uniref:hypothetical protein n=1 Tax=Pseudorhodoferax sp. TaxID=1993553 RepID=UPI0039E5F114